MDVTLLCTQDLILTGGVDASVVVFDRSSGQIVSTLTGHNKRVTSVKFVPRDDFLLTGSADKTVRIWQGTEGGNYNCRHVLQNHTAEVCYNPPSSSLDLETMS
eukprot:Gb_29380 [translate_table: standard]